MSRANRTSQTPGRTPSRSAPGQTPGRTPSRSAGRTRILPVLAALMAMLAIPASPPAQAATPASLLEMVKQEAEFIMSMRTGDGIIATIPSKLKVVPYHANFATMGLARAYTLLRDTRYSTAAWRWLEWYRDHQLPDGTMSDWIYTSSWVPAGLPDSTDAYAGTFLTAALAVFEATGDVQRLAGLKPALVKAIGAIELTEDIDGLHFARPGWPFKYSMDEAEAYSGFRDAQQLGQIFRDEAMQARAKQNADRLLGGSVNLVDPTTGLYLWAVGPAPVTERVVAPISWIYPGASAQVWAIADRLVTGASARTLMERVEQAQPLWDNPTATTQWYDGHPTCAGVSPCVLPVAYWPRFALAWLELGDEDRAMEAAIRIRNGAIYNNRTFPFTVGDAAQIIMVLGDPRVMAASLSPLDIPTVPV